MWLLYENRFRDWDRFYRANLPCSRDVESYVSNIVGREGEKERGEIVQNKSCQYLCPQDVQKCKRLTNCLPTVSSLKLAMMELFTPQTLANATNQGSFSLENWLLNISENTVGPSSSELYGRLWGWVLSWNPLCQMMFDKEGVLSPSVCRGAGPGWNKERPLPGSKFSPKVSRVWVLSIKIHFVSVTKSRAGGGKHDISCSQHGKQHLGRSEHSLLVLSNPALKYSPTLDCCPDCIPCYQNGEISRS